MSILTNLTEGIVNRDLSKEGEAILNKWEKTGLLEGLDGDFNRNQMAVLLENQAKELLRESNTMAGGDVEGFAAVAFPIVRRVFGGLLAQKLVSVQPMSLPSGLVFFMDFIKQKPENAFIRDNLVADEDPSVYGGQAVGSQIETQGVNLESDKRTLGTQVPQFYNLVSGHSNARGAVAHQLTNGQLSNLPITADISDENALLIDFDADLLALAGTHTVQIYTITRATLDGLDNAAGYPIQSGAGAFTRVSSPDLRHLAVVQQTSLVVGSETFAQLAGNLVRRLTKFAPNGDLVLHFVNANGALLSGDIDTVIEFAMKDNIGASATGGAGSIIGATAWEMESSSALPEIAIKVDSTAITAVTRKLKASWTPELAQDLNAYHNLDAEVELTGILSEQIALEIDQEILSDLISGAKANKLYWSRRPGLFVNRVTGADATSLDSPPDFTGSVSEWYETLIETINDVSADIHRKTLRGGANFLVCGPEVANILEFTTGFRASVTHDDATGSVGAVQIGSINKKWDLHVDPYFPRNVVLVGRKGSSFLESGFVYAPYVPLQVTPTIFDTENFTPRKAVMTRYGKKMVRPDMYGLVVVRDLEG
jgi:hypothetical protein